MRCRHCAFEVVQPFVDLGASPPSNAYLTREKLDSPEVFFPLRVLVCTNCWLVQTQDFSRAEELFSKDYAYFSSVSRSWLQHGNQYAEKIITQLHLNDESFVIEVASNDGYLLKNFVARGIPCLGIEPTDSTAMAAESLGIPTLRKFFEPQLANHLVREGQLADLIIGNNVYAHVPDINGFTSALKTVLKPAGTINLEFPHLKQLIERTQFDTIYHEHFSYLSLHVVQKIFADAGLRIWDVEELSTHGGSLRIYGCHNDDRRLTSDNVERILAQEALSGMTQLSSYEKFQRRTDQLKDNFLTFLIDQKRAGRSVAGYGAAAKGNTLLNYAGVKTDLLPYVCDAAVSKQGKYMPGSRIPILSPDALLQRKPDFVIIFPWNIADEVLSQHGYAKKWGGQFVVAVPTLHTL